MTNARIDPRSRTLSLLLLATVTALAAAWAAITPAGAADLIQAEPHPGDTVAEAPHQLVLTFDVPLALLRNAHYVEVTDADGNRVDDGHASISTYSARTLIVPLEVEHDGALNVHYRILYEDSEGELVTLSNSYSFNVDHNFVPPESGVEVVSTKSGQSLVLWTIAILIAISLAGGMVYFLRMATGNARSSLEPQNRTPFRD